ncbi:division/cell wall cluster transcriptional repressor MraZ [Roseivirga sp. BDSF3-8]|uniref:division/cell wall cluster transcriptional repressor MraZ n=1 Tax=Roseivirga sp. BDSF3-8 TaxID=3241598 RepID=UPI003531A988
MAFFTSEYECKLDSKGRLTLPAKIKSSLPDSNGDELVLRRGFEPCLVLYPMVEYKKTFAKIAGLNEFNEEYRKLQRNFFRGNVQVELDSNNRLNIPKALLQYAGLDKEAIVVGTGKRVEIWNPDKYEEYLIQDPKEMSQLAQKFLDE